MIQRRKERAYTNPSGTGNFKIMLGAPVSFRPGTYWISVRVNLDYDAGAGGEWAWLTNNISHGSESKWKNPGDGFETGCVSFTRIRTCYHQGEGPDFAFALVR